MQYLEFFSTIVVSKKVVKKLSKGQTNDMFKQMEELFLKVDKLTKEVKCSLTHGNLIYFVKILFFIISY